MSTFFLTQPTVVLLQKKCSQESSRIGRRSVALAPRLGVSCGTALQSPVLQPSPGQTHCQTLRQSLFPANAAAAQALGRTVLSTNTAHALGHVNSSQIVAHFTHDWYARSLLAHLGSVAQALDTAVLSRFVDPALGRPRHERNIAAPSLCSIILDLFVPIGLNERMESVPLPLLET